MPARGHGTQAQRESSDCAYDFNLVEFGTAGKVLARKKFTQKRFLAYTANIQPLADRPGGHALAPVSSAWRYVRIAALTVVRTEYSSLRYGRQYPRQLRNFGALLG